MEKTLLHVVSFTLSNDDGIPDVLRHLRRLCARSERIRSALLLFCDLPSAPARKMPQDEPMIKKLLSGVMAMNARREGSFFLLVRSRVWDDASRKYLGDRQQLSCRQVLAQLLETGKTQAVFDAASISPASLKGRYAAVLFSSASLACSPDTPMQMHASLLSSSSGAVAASVFFRREYPQSVLARLCAAGGFSLSPLRAAQENALALAGQCPAENPALYTAEALIRLSASPVSSLPASPGCIFVRRHPVSLEEIIDAYKALCVSQAGAHALIPLLQIACLSAAALLGFPLLVAAALLPELWALMHPRQWPGVLLRIALMPLTALVSLDAILCRLLARSPLLRLRVPQSLLSPLGCILAASALLPAALSTVQALSTLLPVLLLWLSAPLLLPALDKPTLERIPLDAQQQAQLRALTESAYFDAMQDASSSPALSMLSACAGCMLGLLEPDEAARHTQTVLAHGVICASSADQAAVLASAQYLRERMRDCDAALRPLPAQLEALALAHQSSGGGALSMLLHASHSETFPAADMTAKECAEPIDLLFLPLLPARDTAQHALSLPLTHPHTYLKRQLLAGAGNQSATQLSPICRFLFLAAAALDHPFYALLQRSPVTGPYAAMLAI